MISGVTFEVSCVLRVAPATLTPTIAVPPRLGVACAWAALVAPRPSIARPAARRTGLIMALLLGSRVLDVCPSRPPWPDGVRGRVLGRRPVWPPAGIACSRWPD